MWRSGSDEDKQGLVRSLFEEIVINLDRQRINSFKLKPWADNFTSLRAALYQEDENSNGRVKSQLLRELKSWVQR